LSFELYYFRLNVSTTDCQINCCIFYINSVKSLPQEKIKGVVDVKGNKILLTAITAFVFIAAAVVAIYLFRNEIADFFVEVKSRIDEKMLNRNGEYVE